MSYLPISHIFDLIRDLSTSWGNSESYIQLGTAVCGTLAFAALFMLVQGGLFYSVNCQTAMLADRYVIAYKIAHTKRQEKAYFNDLVSMLPTHKKIRIIYDKNLRKNKVLTRLIYATGLIISDCGVEPDLDLALFLFDMGYTVHRFPELTYAVVATHPYQNFMSVWLSRNRFYKAFDAYVKKFALCAHPKMEIYSNGDSTITFMSPLSRQNDFYVDEAVAIPWD